MIQSRENLVLVKMDLKILANRGDLVIADVMETRFHHLQYHVCVDNEGRTPSFQQLASDSV